MIMTSSIVPSKKIAKDPQTLPYHFPSFPVVKYSKISSEYHFWKAVSLLEQAAHQNGKLLVPASCLHWERRKKFKTCLITVYKRSFYQLSYEELTEKEKTKYADLIVEEEAS